MPFKNLKINYQNYSFQYVGILESFWNQKDGNEGEFIQLTGIIDMKGFGIQHLTVPAGNYI